LVGFGGNFDHFVEGGAMEQEKAWVKNSVAQIQEGFLIHA